MNIQVRPAKTSDVTAIREMSEPLVSSRVLLGKELVEMYESVPEFVVAEQAGEVIGCGALHVIWEDLAEVRTLVVAQSHRGNGVGAKMLERLLENALSLGVQRVFCLTFEVDFFSKFGFQEMTDAALDPEVYAELVRSTDDGIAEFLDLARVKQNTLGNTRMLKLF